MKRITLAIAALCLVNLPHPAQAHRHRTDPATTNMQQNEPFMFFGAVDISRAGAKRRGKWISTEVPAANTGGYIRGRLKCAVNVNAELARRGTQGTGSALAKSFLSWGRSSGPTPGAVAVFSRGRGGHVAIVHSVRSDGTVLYLNPSSRRQAWQVGPYHRRPIAFRVASL